VSGDGAKTSTSRSAQAIAEAEVRKAQDELIDAYLRRDVGALDRLLAAEYTFVNDDAGGVADKKQKQILASFGSGGDRRITSYRRQDDRVQLYGDVAVLTYRYQSTETYKGHNSGGDYRVTRILVKRDGRWQMGSGQETKVSTTGER
jgi:ketosteroid isomerase-like protein